MKEVMTAVCRAGSKVLNYEVTPAHIMSKGRRREITTCRKIYSHMMRKHTKSTLQAIGESINCDHATVLHHLRGVEDAVNQERKTFDAIMQLCEEDIKGFASNDDAVKRWRYLSLLDRVDEAEEVIEARIKDVEAACQKKVDALTSAVNRHTSINAGCPGFIREKLRKEVSEIVG